MDWQEEVRLRLKRNNMILFSKNSSILQSLEHLIQSYSRRTVFLWAIKLAEQSASVLEEKYPGDTRPIEAVQAARLWAAGEIKMPRAKTKILNCHAMAKELTDPCDIALCHAVAQACSVVHTAKHAMGYPIYELTAIVRKMGIDKCEQAVETRVHEYITLLADYAADQTAGNRKWADFMLK